MTSIYNYKLLHSFPHAALVEIHQPPKREMEVTWLKLEIFDIEKTGTAFVALWCLFVSHEFNTSSTIKTENNTLDIPHFILKRKQSLTRAL